MRFRSHGQVRPRRSLFLQGASPIAPETGKATLTSVDSNGLRYLLAGRTGTPLGTAVRFGADDRAAESRQSGACFVGRRCFEDSQLSTPYRQLPLYLCTTRFHALRIFVSILPLLYRALMTLVMKDTQYNLLHVPHPF
jgi:hypothetical protein